MCFEKRSLIKQQLPVSCTKQQIKFYARFCELIKDLSIVQKSETTYVYFTNITATTWSINHIIPVFIALGVTSCLKEHSKFYAPAFSQENLFYQLHNAQW